MLQNNRTIFLLLVFVFFLGFFVRSLIFLPATFVGERVIFCDTDPYYHMRRITNYLDTGHFIQFDYYLDYPRGAASFWPSGFEKLVAYFSWCLSAAHPDQKSIEKIAVWFPPLAGALTSVLVYFLFSVFFGRGVGVLAAALFVFSPTHIDYSRLGKIDHHVMEVFSSVLFYSLWFFIWRQITRGSINRKKIYLLAAGSGLAIYFAYIMWSGATLYLVPWIFAVYLSIYFLERDKLPVYLLSLLLIFGSAIVFLLDPVLASYHTWHGKISFEALSLFQIIFLILPALFFAGYYYLLRRQNIFVRSKYSYPIYSGAVLVLALLVLKLAMPLAMKNFLAGFALLAKQGAGHYYAWLTTISEYTPMLLVGNRIVLVRAIGSLNWAVVFFLPGIFWYLVEVFRRKEDKIAAIFLLLLTVFFTVLSLQQLRYGYISAVFVCGWAAYFLVKLYRLCKKIRVGFLENVSNWLNNLVQENLPFAALTNINLKNICLLFILYFFWRNYGLYRAIFLANPPGPMLTPYDYDTLVWIRENTPDPGFYDNPVEKPSYGLMNIWDWGHFIEYVARRPAAVNPYGMGIEKMVQFYLARTEEEANRVMEENNCRYALTADPLPIIEGLRKVSLLYPGQDFQLLQFEGPYLKVPKKDFLALMGIKLHLHDGSRPYVPDMEVAGLKHWRLVYESPELSELTYLGGPQTTNRLKVFEYVRGAVYRGRTRPRQEISVQTSLVTNTGREFNYINKYVSDESGNYEIVLPYAFDSLYPVKMTTGDYTIEIGKIKKKIRVREVDVQNGKIISGS